MEVVHISVVSDVICPWCYIGKRRLERALAQRPELRFDVSWHPFELHPYVPVEGMDRATLFRRKFGVDRRANAIVDRIASEGSREGIAFDFDGVETIPNTLAAHCVLHWAAHGVPDEEAGHEQELSSSPRPPACRVQNDLAEAIFRAVFEERRDIGNHETLATLGGGVGMDSERVKAALDAGTDRERIRDMAHQVRGRGVMGVPHFLVEDRYPIPGAQQPDTILHVIDTIVARE